MVITHGNIPISVESHELVDQVADNIAAAVGGVPGVRLEHKGVSITVHVRAVEPRAAAACFARR